MRDTHVLINIIKQLKNRDDGAYRKLISFVESFNNERCNFFTFVCSICQILNSSEIDLLNQFFPSFFDIYKITGQNIDFQNRQATSNLFQDGTLEDFLLFDKIKKLLRHNEVYENFMKCVKLFIEQFISADELFVAATSFIGKSPILLSQFKHLIRRHLNRKPQLKTKKVFNYEIDFSSNRKMGVSYRALPASYEKESCSGRTQLCNEVLNDTWVSFPSWSEDIPSKSCKISAYQEFVYRCEDERYELDIVIENVKSSVKIYDEITARMNEMLPAELAKFELDDCLGGNSSVLQKKVIERIYGDRSVDIIQGIKHKPTVAIPIALRRLKSKLADFEQHRTNFNRIWKEQTERQTQRAVANEINTARANDLKETRSKVILNVAEVVQAESDELSKIYGDYNLMRGQRFEFQDINCSIDATNMLKYDLKCLASLENDNSLISITDDMLHIFHHVINFANGTNNSNFNGDDFKILYLNGYWFVVFSLYNKLSRKLFEIKQELAKHFETLNSATTHYGDVLFTMNGFISGAMDSASLEYDLKKKYNLKIANNALACDKLLQSIVRQLQLVSTDEASKKVVNLFVDYQIDDSICLNNDSSRKAKYAAYTKKSVQLLDGEYCFKLYTEAGKQEILCQMVDTDIYMEENVDVCRWERYLDTYLHDECGDWDLIENFYKSKGFENKLFLKRNLRPAPDSIRTQIIENDDITFARLSYKFTFGVQSGFYMHVLGKRKKKCDIFSSSSKRQKIWFSELTEKNLDD